MHHLLCYRLAMRKLPKVTQFATLFRKTVVGALAVTAMLKLSGVVSAVSELDKPDPVFYFLSMRQVLLLAAVLEAVVAWWVTRWRDDPRILGLILWLGGVFLLYRGAAWLNGWSGPCKCLGGRYGMAFFLPVYLEDWLAKGLLCWMVLGAGSLLAWQWWSRTACAPRCATAGESVR